MALSVGRPVSVVVVAVPHWLHQSDRVDFDFEFKRPQSHFISGIEHGASRSLTVDAGSIRGTQIAQNDHSSANFDAAVLRGNAGRFQLVIAVAAAANYVRALGEHQCLVCAFATNKTNFTFHGYFPSTLGVSGDLSFVVN